MTQTLVGDVLTVEFDTGDDVVLSLTLTGMSSMLTASDFIL
jgi:hypothetical protein